MSKYSIFKPKEMTDLAHKFKLKLEKSFNNSTRATVVGLIGKLGAGKTVFSQSFGAELNIDEKITSPTFVLMRRYDLKGVESWKYFYHLDLYRLSEEKEMDVLKWDELEKGPNNLIFVEWPERIEKILNRIDVLINFEFISEYERTVEFPFDI